MKPDLRYVACPRCGTQVAWTSENRYRPFCSERCKTIDLGAWANEEYRVAVEEDDESPDDNEDSQRPS
ncbi:MAG TPA: DNA gyrase inhibitor YacG [Burkholderiales bacterium]